MRLQTRWVVGIGVICSTACFSPSVTKGGSSDNTSSGAVGTTSATPEAQTTVADTGSTTELDRPTGGASGCGDGEVDPGEGCDDGNNDGIYGGCNPDCTLAPYCGDGFTDEGEQCDDENAKAGDGCTDCVLSGSLLWSTTLPVEVVRSVDSRDFEVLVCGQVNSMGWVATLGNDGVLTNANETNYLLRRAKMRPKTGYSVSWDGLAGGSVARFSASHIPQWTSLFASAGVGDFEISTSGATVVASGGATDRLVRQLDPDGEIQWDYTFVSSACSLDVALSGNVLVGCPFGLRSISSGGLENWVIELDDIVRDVAADNQGFVAINISNGSGDSEVRRYGINGAEAWAAHHVSPSALGTAAGIAVSSDGSVYMVGVDERSDIGQGDDIFLDKWDRDGELLWSRTLDLGGDERAVDLTVLPDGSVTVVGYVDVDGQQTGWAGHFAP